jgi:3',5'-cyclic-AMP phosphodiesterase
MLKRRDFIKLSAGVLLVSCQKPTTKTAHGLRFAVASDGHYGQPNTPFEQNFKDIIANLQTEKKERGLDFVVFNGDLFHDKTEFLPIVKTYFDQLGFPYYVTRGNHDHVTADQWKQTFGYDLNHAVEMGDFAILLADTSNEKGTYLCPNANWIDGQLDKLKDKKGVFLFMHIPYKKWSKEGVECLDLEKVLAKYTNLKAGFHGHDHSLDVAKIGEIPFFFDGHFGGNWGVDYKGYRVVEASPDGHWQTYQYNPSKQLKVNENSF